MKITTTNAELAAAARAEMQRHKPRTPERAAAVALWVALGDTNTIDAAKRALTTFGDDETRTAALELLGQLLRGIGEQHQDHDDTEHTAP